MDTKLEYEIYLPFSMESLYTNKLPRLTELEPNINDDKGNFVPNFKEKRERNNKDRKEGLPKRPSNIITNVNLFYNPNLNE